MGTGGGPASSPAGAAAVLTPRALRREQALRGTLQLTPVATEQSRWQIWRATAKSRQPANVTPTQIGLLPWRRCQLRACCGQLPHGSSNARCSDMNFSDVASQGFLAMGCIHFPVLVFYPQVGEQLVETADELRSIEFDRRARAGSGCHAGAAAAPHSVGPPACCLARRSWRTRPAQSAPCRPPSGQAYQGRAAACPDSTLCPRHSG